MGNALEGKTYIKGSHKSIQPKIAYNVDPYKSHQRLSSSSNIHSQISFIRPIKSGSIAQSRPAEEIVMNDMAVINE